MVAVGTVVVARGPGVVQIGTVTPLVLTGVTPAQLRVIETLAAGRDVSPARRAAHADLVRRVETHLGAPARDLPPASATVDDGGAVGLAIAAALAGLGWEVDITDGGPCAGLGVYDGGGGAATTRAGAASHTLRRRLPGARLSIGRATGDVAVLVSRGLPAVARSVPLMARETPHLFVVTDEAGAVVGPLVVPGVGPCGTCLGLAASEADPLWPHLADQCTVAHGPARATAAVAAAVAGTVAAACQAWRAGAPEPWLGARWRLSDTQPPTREAVAAAAACGCGAAGDVGDEVSARRGAWPTPADR